MKTQVRAVVSTCLTIRSPRRLSKQSLGWGPRICVVLFVLSSKSNSDETILRVYISLGGYLWELPRCSVIHSFIFRVLGLKRCLETFSVFQDSRSSKEAGSISNSLTIQLPVTKAEQNSLREQWREGPLVPEGFSEGADF